MQVLAVVRETNGGFTATFPDFPGATALAENLDLLMARASEVLAGHLDAMVERDVELPQPRTLAELEADAAFRRQIDGAMIALISYAPPARPVRINITVDKSLLARIDRAATALDEARSSYIVEAIKRRLTADATAGQTRRAGETPRLTRSSKEVDALFASFEKALRDAGFDPAERDARPEDFRRKGV